MKVKKQLTLSGLWSSPSSLYTAWKIGCWGQKGLFSYLSGRRSDTLKGDRVEWNNGNNMSGGIKAQRQSGHAHRMSDAEVAGNTWCHITQVLIHQTYRLAPFGICICSPHVNHALTWHFLKQTHNQFWSKIKLNLNSSWMILILSGVVHLNMS